MTYMHVTVLKILCLQPWLPEILHDTCLAEKGIFGEGTVCFNTAAALGLTWMMPFPLTQAGYIPVCNQLQMSPTFSLTDCLFQC